MLFITKSHKCISFISRRWLPGVFTRSVALLNRAYSPHHPSSEVGIVQADFRQIDNNVGSDGQNYTVNQIGEMIQKLVPTAQVLHFVPRWGVEQGIQQVIDGLHSGAIADYHAIAYSNVEFLRTEGTTRLIRQQPGWVYELIDDVSPPRPAASETGLQTAS
jgi:hypothetical protein